MIFKLNDFFLGETTNLSCIDSNAPNYRNEQYTTIDQYPYFFNISGVDKAYEIYAYRCNSSFPSDVSIEFYFQNKWGYLNPELFPIMIISFIEALYYLVVLILWLVNRFHHSQIITKLNGVFVVVSGIMVIGSVMMSLMLFIINASIQMAINPVPMTIASNVFKTIRFMALLVLALYIASGISIVFEVLEVRTHVINYVISFLFSCVEFMSSLSLSFVLDFGSVPLIITLLILLVVFYIIYAYIFVKWSTNATKILTLHLYAIQEAGIDPLTTPSYKKFEMLKNVRLLSLFLFVIELFSCIVYNSLNSYFWVVYLILSIIRAVIYGVLCYLCRVRRSMASTYFDDESAYIVSDDSLPPTTEQEHENANHNLEQWHFGKPLPPMPTSADLTRIHGYITGEDDNNNKPTVVDNPK